MIASLLVLLLLFAAVWAVKAVQVVRSVDTRAEYWSQPRGDGGGLLYVALGDSAAQGIGASSPDNGYVGVLAERLRESTGGPVQIVNLSRSGARIGDVLDRQLPALAGLSRAPDVVTVAIGGNDIRAYDQQTFAEQVERLTAALPRGTYVADAPYFMHGRWQRDAEQAADLLRRGAESEGLQPVRLQAALKAQGWQAMFTQFAADWFHPNDRGHRVWADAFWQEISVDLPDLADGTRGRPSPDSAPASESGASRLDVRGDRGASRTLGGISARRRSKQDVQQGDVPHLRQDHVVRVR